VFSFFEELSSEGRLESLPSTHFIFHFDIVRVLLNIQSIAQFSINLVSFHILIFSGSNTDHMVRISL
jgi:hypothetical protein